MDAETSHFYPQVCFPICILLSLPFSLSLSLCLRDISHHSLVQCRPRVNMGGNKIRFNLGIADDGNITLTGKEGE